VCVCWQLQERKLQQQIELLRTQKDEAESAVRSNEEELEQKGEFVNTQHCRIVIVYELVQTEHCCIVIGHHRSVLNCDWMSHCTHYTVLHFDLLSSYSVTIQYVVSLVPCLQ